MVAVDGIAYCNSFALDEGRYTGSIGTTPILAKKSIPATVDSIGSSPTIRCDATVPFGNIVAAYRMALRYLSLPIRAALPGHISSNNFGSNISRLYKIESAPTAYVSSIHLLSLGGSASTATRVLKCFLISLI